MSGKTEEKRLGGLAKILPVALFGAICGVLFAQLDSALMPNQAIDNKQLAIRLISIGLAIIVSVVLNLIIHEGGHLICGLLSGYKFVSFRVGSLMLIKSNGKYIWKRFRLNGTAGQCLLNPPDMVDGKYPSVLYHLGGGLLNILFGFIFILIAIYIKIQLLKAVLIWGSFIGIMMGLTNIIPMKIGGMANDGYNIIALGKSKMAYKAMWLQLRVNSLLNTGKRIREINKDYFDIDSFDEIENPLICGIYLFKINRLVDSMQFSDAEALIRRILNSKKKILPLYKNELNCELLFLILIREYTDEEVSGLYNKYLRKYIHITRTYPSRQRLLYAYAKFYEKNEDSMNAAIKAFNQVIKNHPLSGEVKSESELMEYIKKREVIE